jgi:hypothetical protein
VSQQAPKAFPDDLVVISQQDGNGFHSHKEWMLMIFLPSQYTAADHLHVFTHVQRARTFTTFAVRQTFLMKIPAFASYFHADIILFGRISRSGQFTRSYAPWQTAPSSEW